MSARILHAGKLRLPLASFDRIFLLAVGKAAPRMAAAVKEILGPLCNGGLVITKYGHLPSARSADAGREAGKQARRSSLGALDPATVLRVSLGSNFEGCQAIETGHPIPDEAGASASRSVHALLRELNARDLLIVAVSGGASALLPAPADGISLGAKQRTTELLLRAGADITELNTVRKHLSTLKGGGLASLAYPATVVGLLLSDVIGDSIDVIGSGLTAPDPSTFADALAVIDKYSVRPRIPRPVLERLDAGVQGAIPETHKPGSEIFESVHNVIVGSNALALEAAASKAKQLGYRTLVLSSTMQGETREVAGVHAQILREVLRSGHPVRKPACILAGGETTVTVTGEGKGGRNQEFVLAAAIAIAGLDNTAVLSGGTDGTDGPTDAAGAIATGDTVQRARLMGLDPAQHLRSNDAYPFFDRLGDLIKTGPTGTNVMDIHILLAR